MKRVYAVTIFDTMGNAVGNYVFAKRAMFKESLEKSFHGASISNLKEFVVDTHKSHWYANDKRIATIKSVPITVQPIYFNC